MLSPDIGVSELMVIAAVALIVVGPKDLPVLLRKLGQFVARLRGMAADFRASFDEMARQSELDELRKEVDAMRNGQYNPLKAAADDASNAHVGEVFSDIETSLYGGNVDFSPYSGSPTSVEVEPEPAPAKAPRKRPPAKPKATIAKAAAPKPAGSKPKAPPAKAVPAKAKAPARKASAKPQSEIVVAPRARKSRSIVS